MTQKFDDLEKAIDFLKENKDKYRMLFLTEEHLIKGNFYTVRNLNCGITNNDIILMLSFRGVLMAITNTSLFIPGLGQINFK